MSFNIYAQADVVDARLLLAPKGAAGALETTAMEAIRAGANTPADITGILGLAPRLVLQVIGDLWRAGRIVIELGSTNETLRLSTEGEDELDHLDGDDAVATTATTSTTRELAFERLTGRMVTVRDTIRWVPALDRGLIIPQQPDDRELSTLGAADLVDALVRTFEQEGDGTSDQLEDQRVVSAYVEPGRLQVSLRRAFVKLRAGAHLSAAGDLTVAVLDESLTLVQREGATRRLQAMLDSEPRSRLAQAIKGLATQDAMEVRGVGQTLASLRDLIASMDGCSIEKRQELHDLATDVTNQVFAYAQHLAAHEMDVRLVDSSADHLEAITDLIDGAAHQIVIAVPWVRAQGLYALRSTLLGAFDRGVQVLLLWGIDGSADGLQSDEATWLSELSADISRKNAPGRLVYSRRAARSHAKMVIADDRRLLVTSKNVLSDSDHGELGVVVEALDGQSSPVIEAALRYVYRKAPEPRIAYELQRQPGAFGARTDVGWPEVALPRLTASILKEDAPESALVAWRAAWEATTVEVEGLLARPRPTVQLVTDLQHRGLVRDALDATTRVLLTSDRVSEDAVTADVATRVNAAVTRGVEVRLAYRRVDHDEIAGLTTLKEAAATSELLGVTHDPRNHAKVVLHDARVLIGSFNPLSVDANLRHGRSTGELGLHISSVDVSNTVWQAFGGSAARQLPDFARTLPVDPAGTQDSQLGQRLADVLEDEAPDGLIDLLAEEGFDSVIAAHRAIQGDDPDLSRISAATLAAPRHPAEPIALDRVLTDALVQGHWEVAGLVSRRLEAEGCPHDAFVTALAEGDGGVGAYLAARIGNEPTTDTEADALMVVDCVSLLLGPSNESSGDSETFMAEIRPVAVGEFVHAAVGYLRRFGPLYPHAPPSTSDGDQGNLSGLWRDAVAEHASFASYNSRSTKGDALLHALLEPDGELTLLGQALAAEDGTAVRGWYADYVRTKDDSKWLDRATHAATIDKITDNRRRPLLEHRRRLRLAVARLVAALESQTDDDASRWTGDQIAAADGLGALARSLRESVVDSARREDRVLVAELGRLTDWREGRDYARIRRLDDWPFVAVNLAGAGERALSDEELLAAVGRDLATRRSPADAVEQLLAAGDLARADWVVKRVTELGEVTEDEVRYLGRSLTMRRREAETVLADRLRLLTLRCERAGVPSPTGRAPVLGDRVSDVRAQLSAWEAAADEAIAERREQVAPSPERRASMTATKLDYVESLLEAGDLVLAERAMTYSGSARETPHQRAFARWSWRDAGLVEIASWFDGHENAPSGMRGRFTPNADDSTGRAVIGALKALASGAEGGGSRWVEAVQQLVAPAHRDGAVLTAAESGYTTRFYLPYHPLLPRLRWVGGDPITASVDGPAGPALAADATLRLALDSAGGGGNAPVVDIGDVLSMLRYADGDETPTTEDRAARFLTLVAGGLPLDKVIAPEDMPSSDSSEARRQLAWLLSILGLSAAADELERLRLIAGEHPAVLWTLVHEARHRYDPIEGVGTLFLESDLDKHLVDAVETNLGRDEDLLVLALGIVSSLLEEGCTEEALAELLAEEWRANRQKLFGFRVSEVVGRLRAAGYVVARNGRLFSCGCRPSIALGSAASKEWLAERMELVDAEALMGAKAYDLILEMIEHEQQAEAIRLSDAEKASRAKIELRGRLADDSSFDLVDVCRRVVERYSRESVDVLTSYVGDTLVVAEAGPEIWIEALVKELINNAYAAMKGLEFGEGTIFLSVDRDPGDPRYAVVRLRNNGTPMPEEVRDALSRGQRWRHRERPGRGTGLYRFMLFGALKDVTLDFGTETTDCGPGLTWVQFRVPLG